MADSLVKKRIQFGTMPVFLTAISTILGAIMFLRFGYAVGNVGFFGAIAIIVIGHLITIPTAMAISEIATNQKVEGGGEYYIISRSFGLTIGASIGIALFLSQAISVAFYIIAFAEAFDPMIAWLKDVHGIWIYDKRLISIPAMVLLTLLMLTKGADIGMKALYVVVATLAVALVCFFVGGTGYSLSLDHSPLSDTISNPDSFFYVFAICFPAFTGMTAGVGLSGDLKNPKRSIPLGTMTATVVGMVVYVFIAYKLAISASSEDLSNNQLIMQNISIWGPIIPIGLAAATISSALGSVMVAPRTLQALAGDRIFPNSRINYFLSRGKAGTNEPFNASMVTCLIAFVIVLLGDVNFVAGIISMFFMVTYGSICTISFLEHFAADPHYRPSFKSKWYLSLMGAVLCVWLMFKMNAGYAFLSLISMTLVYIFISYFKKESQGVARIFKGVIFQLSRKMHVFLQKTDTDENENKAENWRPSIICISRYSFERYDAFDLLRWMSRKYGFGTYIHLIEGYLSAESNEMALEVHSRLIKMNENTRSNVYVDTLVSPSYTSAIAQTLQLPGVSGKDNNMIMFEFSKQTLEGLDDIVDNFSLIKAINYDVCVLAVSDKSFGHRSEMHIWVDPDNIESANLMILLGYIMLGHPDWKRGVIKIFAIFPEQKIESEKQRLMDMILSGRLPISSNNIEVLPQKLDIDARTIINEKSQEADLCLIGFRTEVIKHNGVDSFTGYDKIGNILFVNTSEQIVIK